MKGTVVSIALSLCILICGSAFAIPYIEATATLQGHGYAIEFTTLGDPGWATSALRFTNVSYAVPIACPSGWNAADGIFWYPRVVDMNTAVSGQSISGFQMLVLELPTSLYYDLWAISSDTISTTRTYGSVIINGGFGARDSAGSGTNDSSAFEVGIGGSWCARTKDIQLLSITYEAG